jgi:hypothetical protein
MGGTPGRGGLIYSPGLHAGRPRREQVPPDPQVGPTLGRNGAKVRSVWRDGASALLGFSCLTVAITFPVAFRLGSLARLENADGQFGVWNVSWVARTLVLDPLRVFDANIFYPSRGTLAYSEANLGAGVLAIPVYWATLDPIAAYNFVLLASFVLSAVTAYALAQYLTGHRAAAAVAAVCFAYCPYVFSHLPHIQLLFIGGLPLGLLTLHRLVDRPGLGRGVLLGLALAFQTYLCAYYGLFLVLAVGYGVIFFAVSRRLWADRRFLGGLAAGALVAALVTLPLVVPYLAHRQAIGDVRTLESSRLWAATWRTYFASAAYAHAWMLPLVGRWGELLFPGFVATLLGSAGAVAGWLAGGRRRELVVFYASLGALAFWASFGPDAGLYRLLHATMPGFTFLRAPSRFGVFPLLTLSVFAGMALAAGLPRPARGRAAAALAFVLAVAESMVPLNFRPVPPTSPAHQQLAALPPGALLELPVYSQRFAFLRARYMLWSTVHWKPLVNAYSDYTPPEFLERLPAIAQFPSQEAFDALAPGVRYALFHLDAYRKPETREALEAGLRAFAAYLRPLYADDDTLLYEILEYPTADRPDGGD